MPSFQPESHLRAKPSVCRKLVFQQNRPSATAGQLQDLVFLRSKTSSGRISERSSVAVHQCWRETVVAIAPAVVQLAFTECEICVLAGL